jgi:DNA-binding MarR family transcriptional regulator
LYDATRATPLTRQARRLYGAFAELVRRYQFRDRDQVCGYGLSVSQCYTLEALAAGPMTMGQLAERLCLKISSATRVVDFLVESGVARRSEDPADRRVCRVELTAKGGALVARIQRDLIAEHEAVLRAVPAESRDAVILAVEHLLAAFVSRACGDPPAVGCVGLLPQADPEKAPVAGRVRPKP